MTAPPGNGVNDALLEAGQRLLRSGTLPDCGGAPVTILVTTSPTDVETGHGVARTGHGAIWSMPTLGRYIDGAEVITVHDDPLDGVLAYGRVKRLASPGQRRALAARDGGCCFPGCTRPSAWTEAHHVIPWLQGGLTSLDNLCFLCPFHHRVFEQRGWRVDITHGHPQWTPPAWLDPQQKPRRNTAHHLPDLEFDLAGDLPPPWSTRRPADGKQDG